jgi:hypothetical protein
MHTIMIVWVASLVGFIFYELAYIASHLSPRPLFSKCIGRLAIGAFWSSGSDGWYSKHVDGGNVYALIAVNRVRTPNARCLAFTVARLMLAFCLIDRPA